MPSLFAPPGTRRLLITAGLSVLTFASQAAPLDSSVALDQVYIPALALSTAAQTDPAAVDKARAAMQRLEARWPQLRAALLRDLSGPQGLQTTSARQTLAEVDRQLELARQAVADARYKAAHEALEEVRLALMRSRTALGLDYFVDRLTAYHEPMEVLALAGAGTAPAALDAARRAELNQALERARTLWQEIEQHPPVPGDYQLDTARAAQLRQALTDERVALQNLTQALQGTDNARVLKAASAVKPPFARAFTAFGLTH